MLITLQTQRLILRDYVPADLAAYYRIKSDPKTMYYLQDIQVHSLEEAQADLSHVLADQAKENRSFYFFQVEEMKTHTPVGSVGYTVTDVTPVGKLVHAGYFLHTDYWNRGYATEAMRRVVEFAFRENDVFRISTGCLQENHGSERVMQKIGFQKEAEHVDWEWHDGAMKTRLEYRMLRRDWEALTATEDGMQR